MLRKRLLLVCLFYYYFVLIFVRPFFVAQAIPLAKLIGGTHQIMFEDTCSKRWVLLYLTGGYKRVLLFCPPPFLGGGGPLLFLLPVSPVNYTSGSDIFFAKIDTLGNLIWQKTFVNGDRNYWSKIAVAPMGYLFVW